MNPSGEIMQTGLTKDLNSSEEVVLVTIALNPDVDGETMCDELDASQKMFSKCIDKLLEREYIDMVDEGENVWKITELGRLALNKFRVMVKFDLIYAQKTNQPRDVMARLEKKKKRFESAYQLSKQRNERREAKKAN